MTAGKDLGIAKGVLSGMKASQFARGSTGQDKRETPEERDGRERLEKAVEAIDKAKPKAKKRCGSSIS